MKKTVINNLLIAFFIVLFINRGFFITSAYEMENNDREINSVVELIVQWFTGENNNIDEDGDAQTDCNHAKIMQHDFLQQLAQSFEWMNLFSKKIKNIFSYKEVLPVKNFCFQIDHPPEV